ncbi:MAG: bifunctional proline dehydrogenase/L-glutamate gamma-semialdehyde dehydrogenase PutA, partial [Proteobacteria bacterium]|nr:bifunctional proline dehydrogenase/L-glutamate gamma-semialdehyde dehydrogenase PutA [Pseudomonadota bacterium]
MSLSAFQTDADLTLTPLRQAIAAAHRRSEADAVTWLLHQITESSEWRSHTQTLARRLVEAVRTERRRASGVDALMHEFSLSSQEGVALMCLAEALLRIPDRATADRLIADKIGKGDWARHLGESPSLFVNAAAWGLLITGKLVATNSEQGLGAALTRLIAKGGEPLIRKGVDLAMRMLGEQFVAGQNIAEALANSRTLAQRGYRHSYDMLGEAALTAADAQTYFAAYEAALHAIGHAAAGRGIKDSPGISIKLSALHPRYVRAQRVRVLAELLPRLKSLTLLAKRYDIGLNIDAEESERLELSLDLIDALANDADLAGFNGIGVVVQAYQKRAPFVIDYLADLARRSDRKLMVRLVKGAYWDAEIKRTQVEGLCDYPVYTRKAHTDLSYLVCAQKLLALCDVIYPQFATHNAHTLAAIYTWAEQLGVTDYEFQCLHGMGETLYDQIVGNAHLNRLCRIYAPVGSHQTLLAYLVRRLLENGANSSFVNQLLDEKTSIDMLLADPIASARKSKSAAHPRIPLPRDLFGNTRRNSTGMDFNNEQTLAELTTRLSRFEKSTWQAIPLIAANCSIADTPLAIHNPADHADVVGYVLQTDAKICEVALTCSVEHAMDWQTVPAIERANLLCKAADRLEEHRIELMALAVREAGKTLPNALGEVREAVDFLRYYAQQIAREPVSMAWGTMLCISPWNFPLAIFIGQLSAALAAGNVVLAKPAEQTSLIAYRAVQLLHEAGIPHYAVQLLPGSGEHIGAQLVADARVRGVVFTGSTEVAQHINRTLADRMVRESCDIPFIAETGGQNVMIVDSSALPEQVVQDVLTSAFDSAGQRCSALRILLLQEDIADTVLTMLQGAMRELCIGDPSQLSTDIGPVIDEEARKNLQQHIDHMRTSNQTLH